MVRIITSFHESDIKFLILFDRKQNSTYLMATTERDSKKGSSLALQK